MSIFLMEASDYESVYDLWTRTPGMGLRSLDDSKEGVQFFLNRNPNTNFVYKQDGKIVGIIMSGHDGRRGYIYHATVEKAYRKRGIASLLLENVINALKKEGIHKVALVAFSDNHLGNDFWEAHGFTSRPELVYRNKSINDENK